MKIYKGLIKKRCWGWNSAAKLMLKIFASQHIYFCFQMFDLANVQRYLFMDNELGKWYFLRRHITKRKKGGEALVNGSKMHRKSKKKKWKRRKWKEDVRLICRQMACWKELSWWVGYKGRGKKMVKWYSRWKKSQEEKEKEWKKIFKVVT